MRVRARASIPALLGGVVSINDRRFTRSGRTADPWTLARWFAEADSVAAAHRLWRAAFVLFLDLLGEALSCGVPGDERVEIVSIDGTFQIILEPTGDGSMAAIATSAGRFSGADHSVTIRDVDGRWQLDPLPGAWSKPAAAHIGEGAREAARRARLAAPAVELAGAEEELARIDHDGAPIRRREQSARTEAGAAPGDERIRAALAAIVEAGRTADALRSRVGEAKTRVAVRRAALDAATSARDEAAQDPGLAAWVADLRGLEEAIAAYGDPARIGTPPARGPPGDRTSAASSA